MMSYWPWYLLNEAINCYYHCEYYACLATLTACVESWLRKELGIEDNFVKLIKLINQAKAKGMITEEEAITINDLRSTRNHNVHFDVKKFPKITSIREGRVADNRIVFDESGRKVDPYPMESHIEGVPLLMLAPTTYIQLNKVITFFKSRYPNKYKRNNKYLLGEIEEFRGPSSDDDFVLPLKQILKNEG